MPKGSTGISFTLTSLSLSLSLSPSLFSPPTFFWTSALFFHSALVSIEGASQKYCNSTKDSQPARTHTNLYRSSLTNHFLFWYCMNSTICFYHQKCSHWGKYMKSNSWQHDTDRRDLHCIHFSYRISCIIYISTDGQIKIESVLYLKQNLIRNQSCEQHPNGNEITIIILKVHCVVIGKTF